MVAIDPLYLGIIGCFIGVFCRTMFLYWKKKKQAGADAEFEFDPKFIYTAGFALAVSFIATAILAPSLVGMPQVSQGPLAFFGGVTAGWGANDIINEIIA